MQFSLLPPHPQALDISDITVLLHTAEVKGPLPPVLCHRRRDAGGRLNILLTEEPGAGKAVPKNKRCAQSPKSNTVLLNGPRRAPRAPPTAPWLSAEPAERAGTAVGQTARGDDWTAARVAAMPRPERTRLGAAARRTPGVRTAGPKAPSGLSADAGQINARGQGFRRRPLSPPSTPTPRTPALTVRADSAIVHGAPKRRNPRLVVRSNGGHFRDAGRDSASRLRVNVRAAVGTTSDAPWLVAAWRTVSAPPSACPRPGTLLHPAGQIARDRRWRGALYRRRAQ